MLLGEIAKALTQRAEHRFGGTLLGHAAKGLLESPRSGKVESEGESVDLHVPTPPHNRDPVPILKQILRILQTLAMKVGLIPKPSPGTPPPLPLGAQLRHLGDTVQEKTHSFFRTAEPTQDRTAKLRMREIGRELAARRGVKFAEAQPAKAAAGGSSGIGQVIMRMGRLAGIVGLVTGAIGLMYGAMREFVTGVVEQNRELARWNAAIAASFSKLDVTRMRLQVEQGAATQGGATQLNEQLENLLIEIQPMKQSLGQIFNSVATGLVLMARMTVYLSKIPGVLTVLFPLGAAAAKAAELLEEINKKDKPVGLPLNILGDLQKQRQGAALQPLPGQGKKPQFIQPLPVQPRKKR